MAWCVGGGLTYRPSPRRSKAEAIIRNFLWCKSFRVYRPIGPTIEWHSDSRNGLHLALDCRSGKEGATGGIRTETSYRSSGGHLKVDDPRGGTEEVDVPLISHPAAPGRKHHRWSACQLLCQRPLHLTKRRLAAGGKDLGDTHALTHLDFTVKIHEVGLQELRKEWPHRALPGAW